MSYLKTLESDLKTARKTSILYRERRTKLLGLLSPTDEQRAEIEELRLKINQQRKEERFLANRIKQQQEC